MSYYIKNITLKKCFSERKIIKIRKLENVIDKTCHENAGFTLAMHFHKLDAFWGAFCKRVPV